MVILISGPGAEKIWETLYEQILGVHSASETIIVMVLTRK